MKSKILIFFVMAAMMVTSVSAWHCADTDEAIPTPINGLYGPWGDNGLLGGTTDGYMDWNVPLPDGCTGTRVNVGNNYYYYDVVCTDTCAQYALVEYYCDDMSGSDWIGHTVLKWKVYDNSSECGYNEIPEFGLIGGLLVVAGAAGFLIFRRK